MQLSFYKLFNLSIIHLLLFTNILAIDRSIGVLNIIDKNEDELNTIDLSLHLSINTLIILIVFISPPSSLHNLS